MRHKDTLALYRYWTEIRDGRSAPMRRDLTPHALGNLLPDIFMLESGKEDRLHFRLAGTRICSYRCAELKGVPFLELFLTEDHLALERLLYSVRQQTAIAALEVEGRNRDDRWVRGEILLLPLDRDMVLGIWSVFAPPFWLGAEPVVSLSLRSIRLLDPNAGLAFLNNRPPIPLDRRIRQGDPDSPAPRLRIIEGAGEPSSKRKFAAFRVFQGGKGQA